MALKLEKSFLGYSVTIPFLDEDRQQKIVLFWRDISGYPDFEDLFTYMNDEFLYGIQINGEEYFVGISSDVTDERFTFVEVKGKYRYHECIGKPEISLRSTEEALQIDTFPIVEIYPDGDTEDEDYVSYLCVKED